MSLLQVVETFLHVMIFQDDKMLQFYYKHYYKYLTVKTIKIFSITLNPINLSFDMFVEMKFNIKQEILLN